MPSDTAAEPPPEATTAEGRKAGPEIREEWLDLEAVKVVRRLKKADFTAYLVGGCVRDLLLGMHPKDFDVATSAHPNQVRRPSATRGSSAAASASPTSITRAGRSSRSPPSAPTRSTSCPISPR